MIWFPSIFFPPTCRNTLLSTTLPSGALVDSPPSSLHSTFQFIMTLKTTKLWNHNFCNHNSCSTIHPSLIAFHFYSSHVEPSLVGEQNVISHQGIAPKNGFEPMLVTEPTHTTYASSTLVIEFPLAQIVTPILMEVTRRCTISHICTSHFLVKLF